MTGSVQMTGWIDRPDGDRSSLRAGNTSVNRIARRFSLEEQSLCWTRSRHGGLDQTDLLAGAACQEADGSDFASTVRAAAMAGLRANAALANPGSAA